MSSGFSLKAFLEKAITGDRLQFLKYLLVGGWNTVFGVSFYSLLCWRFQDKVHYLLLLIPSNAVAVLNAYLCYKFFVFKTRGRYLAEFLRCGLVYGGAMVCSAGFLFLMVDCAGFTPIVGNIISVGIVTIISYLSHRYFSFRETGTMDKLAVVFYAILVGTASLFFLSAYRIPLFWLDEVHIVEMGRSFLSSGKTYASFIYLPDGTIFRPFYYLGPLIQELAYQVFGYVGPRWASLTGLLVATVFCRWWLLHRMQSVVTAFWFPLLVLTHPLFNQSARLVRVDSWGLAVFFLALWCINDGSQKNRYWGFLALAGILSAMAVCVWPTSFLFVGYCVVEYMKVRQGRSCFYAALTFVLGFLLGGFGLLLAMPDFVASVGKTLVNYFGLNANAPSPSFNVFTGLVGAFFFLVKETVRDPFVMILCGWGLFLNRKDWIALLILTGSFLVIVLSNIHTFRMIYLFPLLLIFAAEAVENLRQQKMVFKVLVLGAVVYGFLVSVLYYTVAGFFYTTRDYTAFKQKLVEMLGERNVRIYSRAFEPYYVARDLGWDCFRYADDTRLEDDANNLRLLDRVEYVIDSRKTHRYYSVEEGGSFYNLLRDYCIRCALRNEHGFFPDIGRKYGFYDSEEPRERLAKVLENAGFIQYVTLVFPGGSSGYDSLIIWKRKNK